MGVETTNKTISCVQAIYKYISYEYIVVATRALQCKPELLLTFSCANCVQ